MERSLSHLGVLFRLQKYIILSYLQIKSLKNQNIPKNISKKGKRCLTIISQIIMYLWGCEWFYGAYFGRFLGLWGWL
jgi:hypothetical protein